MDIIIMVSQFVLAILFIVGIHELGHLVVAKYFNMKVEKYYIGFPPSVFSFHYKGTEYGIGAIPLGGFVKIAGMVDESMDAKQLAQEPQPWEFRSKPAWQRLLTMLGGIIFNVISGILIFFVLTYTYGEEYIEKEVVVTHGIYAHPLAEKLGLKTGDKITHINGRPYTKYKDLIASSLFLTLGNTYTIERNGETFNLPIPENFIEELSEKRKKGEAFIEPRIPFRVGPIQPDSGAAKGGLQEKDKILTFNHEPVQYFDELKVLLSNYAGQIVEVEVKREGQKIPLQVEVSAEGRMGFQVMPVIDYKHQDYGIGESFAKGAKKSFSVVWMNILGLTKVITGKVSASKSLMGPIGIAKMFGSHWDWRRFWELVGLISMVLAFMNLLPIPALDGGHAVICVYEMVAQRKPSEKFMKYAQHVGMVLLLALMLFAVLNDIINI